MTSRRNFVRGCASVTGAGLVYRTAGQVGNQEPSSTGPRFRPVKEFRGANLLAVSSDGREICISLANAIETWTYRGGQWNREDGSAAPQDESLRVVELGSWRTVCSAKLRATPYMASFFRDSDALYAVTEPFRDHGRVGNLQVVIDLQTGTTTEEQMRDGLFQTTRDRQLLTTTGALRKNRSLSVVELPDFREVAHADIEVSRRSRSGTDQIVSSQGDVFVYGVDDMIVCRRTNDLSVLWTRRLETTSSRVWRVAISARGDRVAAVAAADSWVLQPRYIAVYDGGSSAPIAKFPTDVHFDQTLALSPNGKLLVVGQRIPADDKQNVDLFVDVYDIVSNRRIARELHCRVPPGRVQNLSGGFSVWGIQFTPDGSYLVTSGYDRTRVWEIAGPSAQR
jgi:WD40 repeat protein